MKRPRTLDEAKERFWSRVDRRAPSECWPWMGPMRKDGYGGAAPPLALVRGRKWVNAARVAWCLAWDAVPIGKRIAVRHDCDYRRCCNPLHLRLGSAAANRTDMVIRQRTPAHRRQARAMFRHAVYQMGWAALTQISEQPVFDAAMTWSGKRLASLRGRMRRPEDGQGAAHYKRLQGDREERIAAHARRIQERLASMKREKSEPWERGVHPLLRRRVGHRSRCIEAVLYKRLRKLAPANRYLFTPHANMLAAVAKLMAG